MPHSSNNHRPHASEQREAAIVELTELVTLVPAHLRESIVMSAMQRKPTGTASFKGEYAIGVIRAAIADVLERHYRQDWEQRWELLLYRDPEWLASRLRRLALCRRPASIRQQLTELLLPSWGNPHAEN